MLLFQCVAIPLVFAGLLACYVGLFFSMGIVMLMLWHLQIQLYHLYLNRGGMPLAFRDEELAPAFPVVYGTPSAPPVVSPPPHPPAPPSR